MGSQLINCARLVVGISLVSSEDRDQDLLFHSHSCWIKLMELNISSVLASSLSVTNLLCQHSLPVIL